VEDGDLIFGTGKMWDWYLSEASRNGWSSSPSTPSTAKRAVEGVEDRQGEKKPEFHWQMEVGLDCNFHEVGKLLAALTADLYQHPEGGLVLVEDNRPRRITSAKELA